MDTLLVQRLALDRTNFSVDDCESYVRKWEINYKILSKSRRTGRGRRKGWAGEYDGELENAR